MLKLYNHIFNQPCEQNYAKITMKRLTTTLESEISRTQTIVKRLTTTLESEINRTQTIVQHWNQKLAEHKP